MSYDTYIVQTHHAFGGGSNASIRVRPLPGQGLDPKMKVECSRAMRYEHPVGTKFKLTAKVTDKEGGAPFLYSRYDWPYEVVSDDEARKFIEKNF